ncbi:uncharacterized protein LOC101853925 [Aplysia californica]|uniref:Uncharacterized protein LOC101853925 n=1 Tax=Aplysia californica TaxID=6500 RepID=A0ABM1VRQ4_APLCA|nr:uncharacterized protein LOC101853925 [Aplysia californica]XP_035825094.1 uncharacterized protein LOC101853925 [Aplysia californica]XP_035825095.1 uncharacterized protein LOC101853925 [Aplysia californica]XP_035825096.1 uncharacterized protein LOC101853925 [Aplysia californica]
MKLLCFERDNITQQCSPTQKGHVYSASFEFYPFHEGATYAIYKGVLSGEGPRDGQFCVVRTMLDRQAAEDDWTPLLRRADEARRLAAEFNKHLGYNAVVFEEPVLTQIEAVSDFTRLFRVFKPHDKRLKLKEFVALERYLEGEFRKPNILSQQAAACTGSHYNSNSNEDDVYSGMAAGDHPEMTRTEERDIIQAFSHFSWLETKQSLVVCGLQGVFDEEFRTFRFCNPVIHSKDKRFGESDGATAGIQEFLAKHRCNNHCNAFKSRRELRRDHNIFSPETNDKLMPSISRFLELANNT